LNDVAANSDAVDKDAAFAASRWFSRGCKKIPIDELDLRSILMMYLNIRDPPRALSTL
jgi:hypothetical protein